MRLGPALKWEPARGGALFPHLYGPLAIANVLWVRPLPLDGAGRHVFPDLQTGRPGVATAPTSPPESAGVTHPCSAFTMPSVNTCAPSTMSSSLVFSVQ